MITLGFMLLIIVAGVLLLSLAGWGTFLLLVQLGVIVREASKPQHIDTYNYSLNQGREVGTNEQKQ